MSPGHSVDICISVDEDITHLFRHQLCHPLSSKISHTLRQRSHNLIVNRQPHVWSKPSLVESDKTPTSHVTRRRLNHIVQSRVPSTLIYWQNTACWRHYIALRVCEMHQNIRVGTNTWVPLIERLYNALSLHKGKASLL